MYLSIYLQSTTLRAARGSLFEARSYGTYILYVNIIMYVKANRFIVSTTITTTH